jgi:hypothetical protein
MPIGQEKEAGPGHTRLHPVKERVKHEVREWAVMFVYLWVLLGLFGLHQSIIMSEQHLNFRLQGFALINALILSKVMLVGEGLRFAQGRPDSRPILIILNKSLGFALLFIVFHILESLVVGITHGKSVVESFPEMAGGHLQGIIALGIIVSVSLVPFFAFRELSRVLGSGRLLRLLIEPRRADDSRCAERGNGI